MPEDSDEYEIIPQREIKKLKDELDSIKQFEVSPTKKMQVTMYELAKKLDKMSGVFEEALHTLRLEEGESGMYNHLKILREKVDKVLEQNADIAEAVISLAETLKRMGAPMAPEMPLSRSPDQFSAPPSLPPAPGPLPPLR